MEPNETQRALTDHVARLTRVEQQFKTLQQDLDEVKRDVTEIMIELRRLENWQLEMNIYFKQFRWMMVLVVAAFITGVINILLNLELHA